MTQPVLARLSERVLAERSPITPGEARELVALPEHELPSLLALAHDVRRRWWGDGVELESLISAKTGGCTEDCAFCSQSVLYDAPAQRHAFLAHDEVMAAARATKAAGATHFCIVVAVRGPDSRLMSQVLRATEAIKRDVGLEVDCSLGLLTRPQAEELRDAGVHHYNHNLEASRSFFPTIVTSHTWEERVETCRLVKDVGLGLCSGGILGMGETWEQRLELAFELAELDPDEIPLNFLNPRPGTPLGDRAPMAAKDALRAIAIFRLVFPDKIIRYGGGRELVLRDLQALGLVGGVNAMIVGNYLTTGGRPAAEDVRMVEDLGSFVRR
ncbi:MAG: biotin synthase BioB [Actinomycetota bacterium]